MARCDRVADQVSPIKSITQRTSRLRCLPYVHLPTDAGSRNPLFSGLSIRMTFCAERARLLSTRIWTTGFTMDLPDSLLQDLARVRQQRENSVDEWSASNGGIAAISRTNTALVPHARCSADIKWIHSEVAEPIDTHILIDLPDLPIRSSLP